MTTKEFKEKAEILLKEYITELSKVNKNDFQRTDRCYEIEDEFLHLVFFFNQDLPLFKEMQSNSIKYASKADEYMKRFIHYLNEFCSVQ